jgi:hypothetical protein
LICLEWFENFRLRHSLSAGREAAKAFWSDQVKREGVEREDWQLKQWSEAIRWYLEWLEACRLAGKDHRSLIERARRHRARQIIDEPSRNKAAATILGRVSHSCIGENQEALSPFSTVLPPSWLRNGDGLKVSSNSWSGVGL